MNTTRISSASRKLVLAAAFSLSLDLAVMAQENGAPPPAAPAESEETPAPSAGADRTDQLAQMLKLTKDQKAKVKPLVDAETQKMKELRGQKMTRDERSKRFKALRDETFEKIKPLLTAEQVARWDHLRNFRPTLPKSAGTNALPAKPVPPPSK